MLVATKLVEQHGRVRLSVACRLWSKLTRASNKKQTHKYNTRRLVNKIKAGHLDTDMSWPLVQKGRAG